MARERWGAPGEDVEDAPLLPTSPAASGARSLAVTPCGGGDPPGRRRRWAAVLSLAGATAALGGVALALEAPLAHHTANVADTIEVHVQPCGHPVAGDACYQAVRWSRDFDILAHPERYKGLTRHSSFDDFQAVIARKPRSHCLPPCAKATEDAETLRTVSEPTATTAIDTTASSTTPTTTITTVTTTNSTTPSARRYSSADVVQFYLYRAQSPDDYPFENLNAADLGGVLWYLQNEVLTMCPRKNNISRVIRFMVTTRRHLMPYVAFDSGKCTVPGCGELWAQHGYRLGCQQLGDYGTATPHWYSVPGPCPSLNYSSKTHACRAAEPGGRCRSLSEVYSPGASKCTYYTEWAGDVDINRVTGISNYDNFCQGGGLEYDKDQDRGKQLDFWNGLTNLTTCAHRLTTFEQSFKAMYPRFPASLDMPSEAICR